MSNRKFSGRLADLKARYFGAGPELSEAEMEELRCLMNAREREREEKPYLIMAHRLAGSILGAASAPLKQDGAVLRFASLAEAEAEARALNSRTRSANVCYAPGADIEEG